MKKVLFSSMILLVCACQNSLTHKNYNHGDEIVLKFGQQIIFDRDKNAVHFKDVVEDSRCPSNLVCIWAGNGKVRLQVNNSDIELNTYTEPMKMAVGNIKVQLVDLTPYPEDSDPIKKEDYKVKLFVTKK